MCETKTKKQRLLGEKSFAMRSEATKNYGKLNRAQNFGASKPRVKRGVPGPPAGFPPDTLYSSGDSNVTDMSFSQCYYLDFLH